MSGSYHNFSITLNNLSFDQIMKVEEVLMNVQNYFEKDFNTN